MGAPPVATQAGTPIAVRAHRFRCRNLEQQPPLVDSTARNSCKGRTSTMPHLWSTRQRSPARAELTEQLRARAAEGRATAVGRAGAPGRARARREIHTAALTDPWEKHRECQTGRCRGGKRREVPPCRWWGK
nr:unnamed protein product [Digitaria exilis]